jgi:DeoR family transcriptional regulator, suf operon transcriptional repressor
MTILRKQLLDSSRGRIVTPLRGSGGLTADDIASRLRLTRSAVRAQLTGMERDGVVQRTGQRPGTTRPSHVFELTPEVEQLLSSAYIPLLTSLIDTFADGLPTDQVETMLRQAGRRLAGELSRGKRPAGNLSSRVAMVSEMMNEHLGALTRIEANGGYVIRGMGCPLAALTGKHPGVCLAIESLISEVLRLPVHECCDRSERPQCCFEIGTRAERHRPTAGRGARGKPG